MQFCDTFAPDKNDFIFFFTFYYFPLFSALNFSVYTISLSILRYFAIFICILLFLQINIQIISQNVYRKVKIERMNSKMRKSQRKDCKV